MEVYWKEAIQSIQTSELIDYRTIVWELHVARAIDYWYGLN